MNQGDYFAVVQGIYSFRIEDIVVQDYKKMIQVMKTTLFVVGHISEMPVESFWDDQNITGVRFTIKVDKKFAGVKLNENYEITLFRSNGFKRELLEKCLKILGLA